MLSELFSVSFVGGLITGGILGLILGMIIALAIFAAKGKEKRDNLFRSPGSGLVRGKGDTPPPDLSGAGRVVAGKFVER